MKLLKLSLLASQKTQNYAQSSVSIHICRPPHVFGTYPRPKNPIICLFHTSNRINQSPLHHVARLIRAFLTEVGIDTSVFKTQDSVRGAATSAAANTFVPVQKILKMANWSNVSTFQQFYYKPVFSSNFGRAVLT